MQDSSKTKRELIDELSVLKKKIAKLEKSGSASRQAGEALRESEQKFSAAFNTNPIPAAISTIQEDRFLNVNDMFAEMFSFSSKSEIIGKTSVELGIFANPLDRISTRNDVEEKGRVHNRELKMVTKDGRVLDMLFSAEPVLVGKQQCLLSCAVDITERKQIEEKLQISEKRHRLFADNVLDVIWTMSLDGRFTYVSPSVLKLRGYTSAEVLHQTMGEALCPESHAIVLEVFGKYMANFNNGLPLGSCHVELEQPCKDGSTVWTEVTANVMLNSDGQPFEIFGVTRDISERKKAEEALRESENMYRTLYETIGDGLFTCELNANGTLGKFFLVNDIACQRLGYSREELLSKTPFDINSDKVKILLPSRIQQILTGKHVTVETEHVTKDGRLIPIELTTNVTNFRNKVIFHSIARDITDRKQAELKLKASKALLSNALEMAHLGHWEYDVLSDLFTFNDQFYRLFHATVDQVGGYVMHSAQYAHRFVHPEDVNIVAEETRKAMEATDPHFNRQIEHRMLYADGTVGYINVSFFIVKDSHGRTIKTYGVNQDITDRKRAEEEKQALEERLRRAEKMEALGLLAGGVAHDLNNVIGVIVGYAELIADDLEKSSPLRKGLLNIMEGGQRAAAIVQDLLTLARRGVVGRKSLNINSLIGDFNKSPEWERLRIYHPSVQLKSNLEPDLLNICASPVHLQKTLFNLVSNAAEAMPGGGNITIKTTNQYLDKPVSGYDNILEGDYVVLSVSDEGEGIPEQDLKRIFEPFYTKKIMGRSGTGLGLAVVWGTLKDHQGYIDVLSEEGKGTIFTLYFPVTREDVTAEAASISVSEYTGRGESILVVDDVKGQRDLATAMLTKLNYKVVSVASGEAALEYLEKNKVDLLVLDMIMEPGMDGLDTYKRIIKTNPGQKAIIVSGFAESDRVHDAQALGAGEYVKKPYVQEKLGMAVKKELSRFA